MKFEKFKDYMYYLLHYPIKNKQLYILFKVTGLIFDNLKDNYFEVRKQSNILTATGKYLDVCGKDMDMPRLRTEDDEAYRRRLMLKMEIAIRAGTEQGMLLVLTALGYEKSVIEPVYLEDSERWAEFIVLLGAAQPSKINDLTIIDEEIMKVKQASAKPAYGFEEFTYLQLKSKFEGIFFKFLYCDEVVCGEHPGYNNNTGHQFSSNFKIASTKLIDHAYPLCATVCASEEFYQPYSYAAAINQESDLVIHSSNSIFGED